MPICQCANWLRYGKHADGNCTLHIIHWHIIINYIILMIRLEGITKNFGSLQVLKGIDLEINKGEVVSIVGPSGAGKTTLLQIMGTLDEPDNGMSI